MSTPEKTHERTAGKTGLIRAQVDDLKADVSEEREERKDAVEGRIGDLKESAEGRVADLKERIEALEADKVKLANQVRWMTRLFITSFFVILVFLGVSVGVVSDGVIDVPLVGEISVGMPEADGAELDEVEGGGTDGD